MPSLAFKPNGTAACKIGLVDDRNITTLLSYRIKRRVADLQTNIMISRGNFPGSVTFFCL